MSCLEKAGKTLGNASMSEILNRSAISGYHFLRSSCNSQLVQTQLRHAMTYDQEIVQLSSVLDTSRSSSNNNHMHQSVDLLFRLVLESGGLNA
jgi:hypothetical protein